MSLKTDLIAAKALIDTPEKLPADRDIVTVMVRATGNRFDYLRVLPMCDALDAVTPAPTPSDAVLRPYLVHCETKDTTHADIMALFDRAINAASIDSLDAAIAECAKPLPRHA